MSERPAVEALLNDPDWGQRLRGVERCRALETEVAFALLRPMVEDTSARVRYAAVSQIAHMTSLGSAERAVAREALEARLLQDREPDVRAAAADALAGLKYTDVLPILAEVYRATDEWLVQFSIIAALGTLGNPDAFELLTEALGSPLELIQAAAIGSLGELGEQRAVPLLVPFVNHPDWQVRLRVAQALQQIGSEAASSLREQLATDEVALVAEAARS
ncbi:MAG: HEAT repeat domain-containing protein [Gloeomargaritaceae cyanobacterium C42_A2020_066]|nr:HEAT repeat domain-containing protein [Gloeomargaritaceae cyanobacterium C42_A2020_066]